jgi:hypothetical protein
MTLPEALYTKDATNEPSFLPVIHMTSFDIEISQYEFLKSDFAAEQILDKLTIRALDQIFWATSRMNLAGI